MRFSFMADPRSLLEGFKPSGERYTIAARVHGKLKSAYPNGPPPAEGDAKPAAAGEHKTESAGDADLIIVADSDILADLMWVRSQNVFGQRVMMAVANNGDFLANSVDNLAGSSDLISIRGRQSFFRPFTKVDQLRQHAGEQLNAKEKELDKELKDTEQRLTQLEAGRNSAGSLVMTPEQQAELTRFQQERLRIRKELRDVRRSLDVEIEQLGTKLKFLNIATGAAATGDRRDRAGIRAAPPAACGTRRGTHGLNVMTSRRLLILGYCRHPDRRHGRVARRPRRLVGHQRAHRRALSGSESAAECRQRRPPLQSRRRARRRVGPQGRRGR